MMVAEDIAVRDEILRNMPRRGAPRPRPAQQSAVGYGRITKASKTKLATQRQRVEEYIKVFLPGIPMDAWYEDNDKSRVRCHNREGYQQAVTELLAGQRSHLVTFMLERWSGDDIGMTAFIRSLWAQGIEVHDAVRGKITEENLPLLAQFARLEIKTNSQRSMSKQRAIAEEGYKLGRPPLGYKWVEAKRITDDEGKEHIKSDHGRTEPDQPAWDVLRQVFLMAADETIPLSHTRQWMNEQLGLSKDDVAFHRILTNRYYVGMAVQLREDCGCLNPDNKKGTGPLRYARDENQWVTTTHPHPVCDERTFAAVQRRLQRRKTVGRNVAHPKNPLTGFIYCAKHPHRRMRLHYPRTGHVNYRCRICVPVFGRSATRIKAALAMALAEAVDVQSDPEHVVMTRLTTVETARRSMERQMEQDKARLRDTSRERGNATRHLNAGLISPADYAAAISLAEDEQNEIRARISKVERALASMGQGPDLGAVGHYVAQVRAWCTATNTDDVSNNVAEMRRALQYVVQRITLDQDAGTITISWSPDMAVIMGKEATTVPCPTGRTRRSASR